MRLADFPNPDNGQHVDQVQVLPTDDGWGVFWSLHGNLWDYGQKSDVWYAHVALDGSLLVPAQRVLSVRRHDRVPVYLPAYMPRGPDGGGYFGLSVHDLRALQPVKATDQVYYKLGLDGSLSTGRQVRADLGWSGAADAVLPFYDPSVKRRVFLWIMHVQCYGVHDCIVLERLDPNTGAQIGYDGDLTGTYGAHALFPALAGVEPSNLWIYVHRDACVNRLSGMTVRQVSKWGSSASADRVLVPSCGFWPADTSLAFDGSRFAGLWQGKEGSVQMILFDPLGPTFGGATVPLGSPRALLPAARIGPGGNLSIAAVPGGWVALYPDGQLLVLEHLDRDGRTLWSSPISGIDEYRSVSGRAHFAEAHLIGIAASRRADGQIGVELRVEAVP